MNAASEHFREVNLMKACIEYSAEKIGSLRKKKKKMKNWETEDREIRNGKLTAQRIGTFISNGSFL